MPKQEGQKSKLLALLRIFEQQTDEEHLLNVPQLVELLARQGILCERKSVYSDIDALNVLGLRHPAAPGPQRRLLDGDEALRTGRTEASGGRRPVQPGHLQDLQRQAHP